MCCLNARAHARKLAPRKESRRTHFNMNLMGPLFPIVSSIYSWSASFRWLVGSFKIHDVKQWQPPYILIIYTAEVAISTASYRLGWNTRITNKKRKISKRKKTHILISLGKQRKKIWITVGVYVYQAKCSMWCQIFLRIIT